MRKLEFIGTVRTGRCRFAHEMVIPGRDNLFLKPDDWPRQLAPGDRHGSSDEVLDVQAHRVGRYVGNPEFIEDERKDNLRLAANELLLLEHAKEWLLNEK